MLGLFGGTCNNLYVLAKVLARHGVNLTFIQDRKDNFPHSQPVWEDVDCYFRSGFEHQSIDWGHFENEHEWLKPSWYYTPAQSHNSSKFIFQKSNSSILTRFIATRFLRHRTDYGSVFSKMLECDFLIVCGAEPAVLAMLSGKPYMVFPHGSDMRIAIGAETKGRNLKGLLLDYIITKSFKRADIIGNQLPDASAEVPVPEYRRLKKLSIERMPLPYQLRPRLNKAKRTKNLRQLFSELDMNLVEAATYAFVPSRINFHWKGHDRLLEAILENRESLDCHFIFLGWGDDYHHAMEYIERNVLTEWVSVVPIFCSKEFLFRFYESVDFIVDSLNGSGGYGSSLAEAMSCGCPIVTWISDMFDRPGWEKPTVIQARSKEDISTVLKKMNDGTIDLDTKSRETVEWFEQVHGELAVVNVYRRMLDEFLL